MPLDWQDNLDIGELSDVGMRRSNNQDAAGKFLATSPEQWRSRGHFFLIADGMGAHAVGELASKLAVDYIPHAYHKLSKLQITEAVARAFQEANTMIHSRAHANQDFKGMGTTSTALILLPEGAYMAHVGDSRAYRVRDGSIEQLTFDHSLAWELVRRRQLTLQQARELVPANVITRSLGPEPDVQVDVEGPHAVEPGAVFVLCTDGLSGPVADTDIGILAANLPAQEACQYLVDLANLSGGPDNITVMVVRASKPQEEQAAESQQAPALKTISTRLAGWVAAGLGIAACAGAAVLSLVAGLVIWVFVLLACGTLLIAGGGVCQFLVRRSESADPAAQAKRYRRVKCPLDDGQLRRFFHRLQQLKDLAIEQEWAVDWQRFAGFHNEAAKHAEQGNRVPALKQFCHALHLLAEAQRRRKYETDRLLGA